MYEIHSFHEHGTCLAYNLIQLFLQFETKFIGEEYVPLDCGLLPPSDLEFPEVPIGGCSEDDDGNSVVEKVYRASLFLKDYVTNILIALVVQMSFTRNKVNGSSKVCFLVLLVTVLSNNIPVFSIIARHCFGGFYMI